MITRALGAAALLALAVPAAQAAEAVGHNTVVVPANGDALVCVPFAQDAEGTYTVDATTATDIQVSGNPFTVNQYDGAYYVRMIDGDGEGLWSTITATGTGSLTLETSDVLDFVSAGDQFRVVPHHTIGSLFPENMEGVSHEANTTQVLLYANDINNMLENKAAAVTAIYLGNGVWFGAGVSAATVVPPETRLAVRNNGAEDLVLTMHGNVPDYSVSMLVAAGGDLDVGTGYPVPVVLGQAGLEGLLRNVLIFDNTTSVQNRAASQTALWTGSQWFGAGVDGSTELAPSESITLRLPATEASTKVTIPKPY